MSLVRENVLSAVLDDIVAVVRAAARVGGCGWVLSVLSLCVTVCLPQGEVCLSKTNVHVY